jgi:anti-anti-sigma factor
MHRSWHIENPASRDPADAAADLFHVEIAPERDAVRVSPVGELDMSTADELAAEMRELGRSGFTRIVLDLRDTTFIDSTGLHVILQEYAAVMADGSELSIVPGPPAVQRIFDVTGLSGRLPFVDGATPLKTAATSA